MMKEIQTIEEVAEILKEDWKKHGSGFHAPLLDNSIARFKASKEAQFTELMQRVVGSDEFGRES